MKVLSLCTCEPGHGGGGWGSSINLHMQICAPRPYVSLSGVLSCNKNKWKDLLHTLKNAANSSKNEEIKKLIFKWAGFLFAWSCLMSSELICPLGGNDWAIQCDCFFSVLHRIQYTHMCTHTCAHKCACTNICIFLVFLYNCIFSFTGRGPDDDLTIDWHTSANAVSLSIKRNTHVSKYIAT